MAPIIVVTGPTASGKSALALRLAERWGGEIICADSRTVYKGMDIGTAKPTVSERAQVPHWLLDVALPSERFTVADFQRLANDAIQDIQSRGKIPFLVGGTGLYIDAVILGFTFGPVADPLLRTELEAMSVEDLKSLIEKQHLPMPENSMNKRYLMRCIEKNNTNPSGRTVPEPNVHVIAVQTEKDVLRRSIARRIDTMFVAGVMKETQHLVEKYGSECEAMTGNIYPIVQQIIAGELDVARAKESIATRDWRLAKRQITWLKRHDFVRWLSLDTAEAYIDTLLQTK